ncbi:MAG: class I SAM-dependent methyltransferase [Methylocystaceae bacterium]
MTYQRLIMTSSQRNEDDIEPGAVQMARELGIEVVKRNRQAIATLAKAYEVDGVIVWQDNGPVLHLAGQKFFFHPSMAKARISMLRKDLIKDPMLTAMNLQAGDTILDCTLGLGADAIVAAFATGESGMVTGLEKNPVLAALVAYGMTHYATDMKCLAAAMQRIRVINDNHLSYLTDLPSNTFDIIYFDPMFRQPLQASSGIKPLRLLAEGSPLETEALQEAIRVAKKRVVFKERNGSPEFNRLGCEQVIGSASSPIAYGIIEAGR